MFHFERIFLMHFNLKMGFLREEKVVDIQYLWCFVDAKVIVSRLLLEYNSWKLNG